MVPHLAPAQQACFTNSADNPNPFITAAIGGGNQLGLPNDRPVPVLSQLDINRDGVPDGAVDTDGDGLPDNWEDNGPGDVAKVGFYVPTAIGPGTPAVFITGRLIVFTSADKADTDSDGLTDFIEVFGLKFIDDNGNGKLDFIFTDSNLNGRWDIGEAVDPGSEWMDFNGDGLPSIGEYPLSNIDPSRNFNFDFDGFLFTDPLLPDTDGDTVKDGCDRDPLINPQTFGVSVSTFQRDVAGVSRNDADLDNDGLGNGSDFGNDIIDQVDFPDDIGRLLAIFRQDRLAPQGPGTLPESLIEDLLGADWDGNGFFRITDSKDFRRAQKGTDCLQAQLAQLGVSTADFAALFTVGPVGNKKNLFGIFPASAAGCAMPVGLGDQGSLDNATEYGYPAGTFDHDQERPGLGFQTILLGFENLQTLPDRRIWAILYAWRQPGFDIDGDGFVGSPANSFRDDDRHVFVPSPTAESELNGQITLPTGACGTGSLFGLMATASVLLGWMSFCSVRRRRA